jgi:hypothetical protein
MPREIVQLRNTREEYLADQQEGLDSLRGRAQRRRRDIAELDTTLARLAGLDNATVADLQTKRDHLAAERQYILDQLQVEETYVAITADLIDDDTNDEKLEQQRRAMDALHAHRANEREIGEYLGVRGAALLDLNGRVLAGAPVLAEDDTDDTYRPDEEI